jgi:hypothetical protein
MESRRLDVRCAGSIPVKVFHFTGIPTHASKLRILELPANNIKAELCKAVVYWYLLPVLGNLFPTLFIDKAGLTIAFNRPEALDNIVR